MPESGKERRKTQEEARRSAISQFLKTRRIWHDRADFPELGEIERGRGLQQKDMAALLHMDVQAYQRIERGQAQRVDHKVIEDISKILGLRQEELDFLWLLHQGRPVGTQATPGRIDAIKEYVAMTDAIPLEVRKGPFGEIVGKYVFALDPAMNVIAHNSAFPELFDGNAPKNFFHFILEDGVPFLPKNERHSLRRILLRLDILRYTHPNHPDLPGLEALVERVNPALDVSDDGFEPAILGDIIPHLHPKRGKGVIHSTEMTPPGGSYDGYSVITITFYANMDRSQLAKMLRDGWTFGKSMPVSRAGHAPRQRLAVDTSKAHPARIYDWLLGGKDNYLVDRQVALKLPPIAKVGSQHNRAFMHRTTAFVAQQGVRQFLDIGTGIPTEPNLHQIAQGIIPGAQVVYVDNDPIVLRHAEALLVSRPEGKTNYVHADVRHPDEVMDAARGYLDFQRPIGLSLIGILHFLPDYENPQDIIRRFLDALPSGSYISLTQGASDLIKSDMETTRRGYEDGGIEMALRTRDQFAEFFEGLQIVDPGIVPVPLWIRDGYEGPASPAYAELGLYGAVGRKP